LDIEPGAVVAKRYRVQRQLGRGGMGEVFAAENIRTGRTVAVKVLRADSKQKSSAVERFRREARAAGAISSDYVTQVLDVEEDADHGIVIVFELLEGESLIDRLKRTGPMTFDELFPIVEQVWMGLSDAHRAGVIHRDLKPSNVFLERRLDGSMRVKILDFGISKLPKEVGGETLTEMGQSLGTFSFMPPEQIGKAKTVDHRADIYACATLIYQALSGQLPYAAKNILQMVDLKTKSEPRALSSVLEGRVDPRLEAFLRRALARRPEDRFQSAWEALEGWRELRRPGNAAIVAGPAVQAPAPDTQRAPPPNVPRQQPAQVQPLAAAGQPMAAGGAAGGRPAATVMITDPRSGAASPLPAAHNLVGPYGSAMGPAPQGLGGTVAIVSPMPFPAVVPPSGMKPAVPTVSGVPVVSSDTTSESGADSAATVAMPIRTAVQQPGPPGGVPASSPLPRLHDDRPEHGGTQLMSHAAMRGSSPNFPGTGLPPPTSARGSGGMPAVQLNEPPPAAQGEADLTTVYRRERQAAASGGAGPPTMNDPLTPSRGSRMSMILGVLAFALVGFFIAAAVIHYMQTGKMIWQ
jgi:serine/threonine-protein kinase